MKKLFLALVLMPLFFIQSTDAATPQEQCQIYYGDLKNFVQQQFYEPPAGYCILFVQTDGERIVGANLNEGSLKTCTSVVETFDRLLYKDIPKPPNDICKKNITFEFRISEDSVGNSKADRSADKLKAKLHVQLKSLADGKVSGSHSDVDDLFGDPKSKSTTTLH